MISVKKILPLFLLLICSAMTAQDYVDVVKVYNHYATLGNVEDDAETDVRNLNAELYLPAPIAAGVIGIVGATYENTRLGLNFDGDRSNLIMTRLNMGLQVSHKNRWTGTYVLLPKLAGDFEGLSEQDFQIGGLGLLKKSYSSKFALSYGMYASSERFGATITPLVGIWYKSPNRKFYINSVLPIRTDIFYELSDSFGVGLNVLTSIKSYNLGEFDSSLYVQEESIRAGFFLSYTTPDDFMIRAKVGFDTTDYGVYNDGDTIGPQILTWQVNGDDRNRLNAEFDSSLFFGLDLIYRTNL
jgi:hypothetical protein